MSFRKVNIYLAAVIVFVKTNSSLIDVASGNLTVKSNFDRCVLVAVKK